MRVDTASGSRYVVHTKPQANGSEFITVERKSGVQWASCNRSETTVEFSQAASGGAHGNGVSWVTWLFIVPGAAGLALAVGLASPAISLGSGIVLGTFTALEAIATALATLLFAGGAATAVRQMEFIKMFGEAIAQVLPAGARVQFVEFEQPCNADTAGVDF